MTVFELTAISPKDLRGKTTTKITKTSLCFLDRFLVKAAEFSEILVDV